MSIFAPVITCNSDRITVLNSNSIDVRIYIQKNSVERYEEQYWIDYTQSYARTNSVIIFDGIGTSNLGSLSPVKGFFAAWYRIRFVAADGSGRISEWVYCPYSSNPANRPAPVAPAPVAPAPVAPAPVAPAPVAPPPASVDPEVSPPEVISPVDPAVQPQTPSINIISHNNCLCPEITRTPTRTSTPTSSPTPTPTITVTSSVTPTLTSTPTPTPTTTVTKSLTPTPTTTRTETPTPTPTPTITVTPSQTKKNCCEWDGNTKIYYAIDCVNGSPVWRNLNIQLQKISNYEWVFNKIVECNELLDLNIKCNSNIILNNSDLSCINKWNMVVNKWPCHNAPFTTTIITSSNINNLNLPQVMRDDIISSVWWPKACECNTPGFWILNGSFDTENCSCCTPTPTPTSTPTSTPTPTPTSTSAPIAEFRWLRSQARIGSISDLIEQVWLVASNQPPGAPYPAQQIPGTQSNAEWMPNDPGPGGAPIVYPLTDSTQTFYVTYDKIARNVKYRLQNGAIESVAIVPVNKLISETVNYPIGIYVEARGRTANTITTLSAKIKFFNCTLSVVGEPLVQLPDTEVSWNRGNWVPGQPTPAAQTFERTLNPGYKLGKGFTINGSITMSWEGIRPTGSLIQGWIVLYDFTRDYIL